MTTRIYDGRIFYFLDADMLAHVIGYDDDGFPLGVCGAKWRKGAVALTNRPERHCLNCQRAIATRSLAEGAR